MSTAQTQQTQNVMDAIVTEYEHDCIFQKFGSITDNRVVIFTSRELKSTSLYVNHKRTGDKIKNITWERLEQLQKEAFEMWLALQN